VRKTGNNSLTGWVIFLGILVSGYFISVFENYNLVFLTVLILESVLVLLFNKRFGRAQILLSKAILGLLFIYSGFVKGVDPVGTQYRIEDYFMAFGTDWAMGLALPLSVVMNAWEFILGIIVLFSIRIRFTRWLLLLTMAVFTIVTINDALYNPVPDCGCFGDALIISNWQTLYKNLVIDALLLLVFFSASKSGSYFPAKVEAGIFIVFLLGFVWFEFYNIRHLPMMDFRDWKVGNKMMHEDPLPKEYYLSYKNTESGEITEYLSPDYPYNDSSWMATHEFVSQRVVDPNPPLHDLGIEDVGGNDVTPMIVENPDLQFVLVAEYLDETSLKKIEEINKFIESCNEQGIAFVTLTSSIPEEVEAFKSKYKLETEFYFSDDISLKSMIRSNPGLILLKEGVVLDKWHYNDFPKFEEEMDVRKQD